MQVSVSILLVVGWFGVDGFLRGRVGNRSRSMGSVYGFSGGTS